MSIIFWTAVVFASLSGLIGIWAVGRVLWFAFVDYLGWPAEEKLACFLWSVFVAGFVCAMFLAAYYTHPDRHVWEKAQPQIGAPR